MSELIPDTEKFWRGEFGDQYVERNRIDWRARMPFWKRVLETTGARSILEVGCGSGWNLLALRELDPTLKLRGVDLNDAALEEAKSYFLDARCLGASEVGVHWPKRFDLVFSAGVLIHVAPEHLRATMRSIMDAAKWFVLAVEYDNPVAEEVEYRGHKGRLWKRPYGKLYEDIGVQWIAEGPAEGFDRCQFWLMGKG